MKYLKVKNWTQFQHYKDRNPPWVKFHFEILASQDWVMLADASKLLACVCMLVASRHDGKVPNDPAYIKRVAYLDVMPDLQPLIDCGFLEVLADASMMQADARQEAEAYSKETYSKETERDRLSQNFKILELSEEGIKFANDNGIINDHLLKCWQKFKIHWQDNPPKYWIKAWQKWVLSEKLPVGVKTPPTEKALVGDELLAQQLGTVVWLRERKMLVNATQERAFAIFEKLSGIKVTWRNNREWKEQGAIPLNNERYTKGKSP